MKDDNNNDDDAEEGNGSKTLGHLHDYGKNGDAVAGDKIFTISLTFKEPATAQVHLQISAAFRSALTLTIIDVPVLLSGNRSNGSRGCRSE